MYSFSAELLGVPPGPIDNKSQDIQDTILQQAYKRAVLPYAKQLDTVRKPFSGNVYGEMLPEFIDTILQNCCLNSKSVVVDLGNVVAQINLRTGCTVFGIVLKGPC